MEPAQNGPFLQKIDGFSASEDVSRWPNQVRSLFHMEMRRLESMQVQRSQGAVDRSSWRSSLPVSRRSPWTLQNLASLDAKPPGCKAQVSVARSWKVRDLCFASDRETRGISSLWRVRRQLTCWSNRRFQIHAGPTTRRAVPRQTASSRPSVQWQNVTCSCVAFPALLPPTC